MRFVLLEKQRCKRLLEEDQQRPPAKAEKIEAPNSLRGAALILLPLPRAQEEVLILGGVLTNPLAQSGQELATSSVKAGRRRSPSLLPATQTSRPAPRAPACAEAGGGSPRRAQMETSRPPGRREVEEAGVRRGGGHSPPSIPPHSSRMCCSLASRP